MKSKNNKLMYVSAAVLAAGAVAGVNTQNAHAAEVQKQADKNAAQKTIDQNQKDLTQTQDQLNKAQAEHDDAVRKVPDAQANVLTADSNNQSAQNVLANAQDQLKTAQDAQAKAQANYDASYENNVKSAQNDVNKANADVQSTQEQINVQNTKQAEALNNRQGQEDALKTNTETLNKTNEEISKTQGQVNDAQKTYDAVNKDYQPVKAELDKQAKEASDAQKAADENAKELAQAQNALKIAQETANKSAETINNAQAKLTNDTNALNGAKSELSAKQKQASDLTSQRDQVAKELQTAQNKMNTAKAELDADKDAVVNTMVMPQVYKDTVKKWSNKKHTDDYYKEMEAASWIGWTQNEYKHNEAEKNHMVDLKHMSRADQIELNKFGIDLINQLRTQIGVDPWTFNESALDFANAIADRYVKDDWDSDKNGHDSEAINELAHQYGLNYAVSRKDGKYSNSGQYYENMMTDLFGWTEIPFEQAKANADKFGNPYHYSDQELAYNMNNTYSHSQDDYNKRLDDMDHLKNQVYNAVKRFAFNYNEWLHAYGILSQDFFNYSAKGKNYAAISFSAKPTPNHWGEDDLQLHFINVHESMVLDPKVFNVNATIPLKDDKRALKKQYIDTLSLVNTLTPKKANLDNQINGLTNDIKGLNTRISDLTKSISDTNKTLADAKATKADADKKIAVLPGRVQALKDKQASLDKAQAKAEADLATYQAKNKDLLTQFNAAKSNLDKLTAKLNDLNSAKSKAESAVAESKANLDKATSELSAISSRLDELKAKLSTAKTTKEQADANLAKAKAAYDEYVSTHKDVIDNLNKANAELAAKTKAYNEAKEDAAKTDKEYQAAQDELTKLNNHIEDLSTAITNYESKIKQLNTTINKQKEDQKRASLDAQINKALDNVSAPKHTATTTTSVQAGTSSSVSSAVTVSTAQRSEVLTNTVVRSNNASVLSPQTKKLVAQANASKNSLPQTGANDKLSVFAALAGLSLASLGLGSLVGEKKRKRN
ncbi:SEC10/PgrA surface exclusion domain-containing protein [Lactobacillus johnsonii]|uniref:SEC10/PgrA surface exclusion domain-containing protein n=1 Tax=Lactobacillus johnsonii TaxID=33959 RepID=UPI001CBE44C7|nr:SEC10/PgrA surface exclusion domain-containing protein [Lactobacillus johnsonii]MBZ4029022.1 SEC10/PgrA surface exclusion domain-containing protein [Lactobacillus johnsonii]